MTWATFTPEAASLGEAARDAGTVADGEDSSDSLSFKFAAQFKTRGVELDLRAIEQGVVICGAWRDLIQSVDHLDDIVKLPLRKSEAQVAGNGRGERRTWCRTCARRCSFVRTPLTRSPKR